MGITARTNLYQKLERLRGCPLIVYVTSERGNAAGQISSDAVREMHLQLEALPKGTMAVDLLIVSNGGDPTVAWRLVSLIRERVNKFSVLIPQAAYSFRTCAPSTNSIWTTGRRTATGNSAATRPDWRSANSRRLLHNDSRGNGERPCSVQV